MKDGFSIIYVIPLVEFSLLEEELLDDEDDEDSEADDELWLDSASDRTFCLFLRMAIFFFWFWALLSFIIS